MKERRIDSFSREEKELLFEKMRVVARSLVSARVIRMGKKRERANALAFDTGIEDLVNTYNSLKNAQPQSL